MSEEPYKSEPKDRQWAWILGIIHVVLAVLLAVMLFKIWPPTPWPLDKDLVTNASLNKAFAEYGCPTPMPSPLQRPTPTSQAASSPVAGSQTGSQSGATATPSSATNQAATGTATPTATPPPQPGIQTTTPAASPLQPIPDTLASVPISILGRCYLTSFDERLILLVIIAGILGSFVHGATSLADFIGNDKFNRNWTWFYLLRPAIGMSLALVFYFVVRGGFLTTSGGAKDINPYGIAALAGLVGMFSKQATDKLSEVFSTLFRSAAGAGDDKRSGSLTDADAITVTSVEPKELPVGAVNREITVTGTNFVNGCQVFLNNKQQVTTFDNATKLTVTLSQDSVATKGIFKLKVVNPVNKAVSTEMDFTVT